MNEDETSQRHGDDGFQHLSYRGVGRWV